MSNLPPVIKQVSARIVDKSRDSRQRYLGLVAREAEL